MTSESLHTAAPDAKRKLLLCLALVACTLATYGAVRGNGFVGYDDDLYVTANQHVQSGLTRNTVHWAFTTFDAAQWQPLAFLAHALDCQLFNQNPAAHHYSSLLLHCLNVVFLFLILLEGTERVWASLAAAAIYAVHPLNVESVAWVAELRNVLSMLFLLLAWRSYQRYARQPGMAKYAIVAAWFACGLMTKPHVITLPFLLLLWDYWPLRRVKFNSQSSTAGSNGMPMRSPGQLLLEKIPLLMLSAAAAIVTLAAQRAGGALRPASQFPLAIRLENAISNYLNYIAKLLWPVHLAPMYPHPGTSLPPWRVALAAFLVVGISALILFQQKRSPERRYLAVGWFWFLGALVPMLGLIQVGDHAMADRYMYLPMIGLLLMLCWGVADWIAARNLHVKPVAALALAVLAILGVLSYRQVRFWHDDETLWIHAAAVTQNNYVAHLNLGADLINRGQIDQAAAHFHSAAQIRPNDPGAQLNLATCERRRGNCAAALQADQAVLRLTSGKASRTFTLINLGSDYLCLKDSPKAKESYAAALTLDPNAVSAWVGLGRAAQQAGAFEEAVRDYSRAVELAPSDVGYLLLADALRQSGQAAGAQVAHEKARLISADFVAAQQAARNLQLR